MSSELTAAHTVHPSEWRDKLAEQQQFFSQFGSRLPAAIGEEHLALKKRLLG